MIELLFAAMVNKEVVRFAPHLEKCMGMGRNSSRVASRRLAAGNKDSYRLVHR